MTRLDPTVAAAINLDAKVFTRERMLSLVVTVDFGSATDAAALMKKTATIVREDIRALVRATGHDEFWDKDDRAESGAYVLNTKGRKVYDLCKGALARMGALAALGKEQTPVVAFLPHHVQFVARAVSRAGGLKRHFLRMLDERHRGATDYERHAIKPLEDGSPSIHLVVGPPPERPDERPKLHTHRLYSTRLEAMVPADHPGEVFPLADLAQSTLLAAPIEFRSRHQLEEAISSYLGPRITRGEVIPGYSPATLVIAQWEGADAVTVLPSDIAAAFHEGGIVGGNRAKDFKWIPIQHDGKEITNHVNATCRSRDRDELDVVVAALKDSASELHLTSLPHAAATAGSSAVG